MIMSTGCPDCDKTLAKFPYVLCPKCNLEQLKYRAESAKREYEKAKDQYEREQDELSSNRAS